MNTNTACTLILAAVFGVLISLTHGGSEPMKRDAPIRPNGERPATLQKALNESAPDWLRSVAPKILPLAPADLANRAVFDRSQGIIQIDGKSLSIEGRRLDYLHPDTIHWAALSPSGKRVVLGMPSRDPEYKVADIANNRLEMTSDSLPKLNYFDEQRWWLNDWIWLSDSALLSIADEEDPTGDAIASTRLYHYDLATKTLQRLDLPNVPPGAVFKVIGIDRKSRCLKISYSDPKEFVQVVQY
jgi:hypothetical protein